MAFSQVRLFSVAPSFMHPIADDLVAQLQAEGYEVVKDVTATGAVLISLSKGGIFKVVLGMKTSLNVTMKAIGVRIQVEAKVGIFGKQLIPSLITLFVAWPVILAQIWGIVKQANLDDHVMEIIEKSIQLQATNMTLGPVASRGLFCPNCGTKVAGGKFCAECGCRL